MVRAYLCSGVYRYYSVTEKGTKEVGKHEWFRVHSMSNVFNFWHVDTECKYLYGMSAMN